MATKELTKESTSHANANEKRSTVYFIEGESTKWSSVLCIMREREREREREKFSAALIKRTS
jgi:predicted protein tyrosine phosphatase